MPASSDIFLFADFRLDRAGGGLYRLDNHGAFAPVMIGSRALDLLAVLIERRGDVVSKDEIMAAVWPRMAVEEGNLFVQISALRAILDKEQSGQSCIQTVIGRGYRFIAPVTRCAGVIESHASPGPHERFPLLPPDGVISSAERRQVTAMVCELLGSATLSSRVDPEVFWRERARKLLREPPVAVCRREGRAAAHIRRVQTRKHGCRARSHRSSLHRGRPRRSRDRMVGQGGRPSTAPLGLPGGDRPSWQGDSDGGQGPGRCADRDGECTAQVTDEPRPSGDVVQGFWLRRDADRVRACARACCEGRRPG